jgi:hypothetical protein
VSTFSGPDHQAVLEISVVILHRGRDQSNSVAFKHRVYLMGRKLISGQPVGVPDEHAVDVSCLDLGQQCQHAGPALNCIASYARVAEHTRGQ